MTATLSRIVLDRLGNPQMIVHPTSDSELSDPANAAAFAPPDTTQLDVPRFDYSAIIDRRAFLVFLQAKLAAAGRTLLALITQARIDLMDAVDQWQADVAAW